MREWRRGLVLTVWVLASRAPGNICLIVVTGEGMLQAAALVKLTFHPAGQAASNSCQHSSEQRKVTNDLHAVKPSGQFSSPPFPSLFDFSVAPNSWLLFSDTRCFGALVFTGFLPASPAALFHQSYLLAPLSLSDLKLLAGPRVPSSGLFCVYVHLFGILALNISMLMIPNFIWPALTSPLNSKLLDA